jgi:hypothetical protein
MQSQSVVPCNIDRRGSGLQLGLINFAVEQSGWQLGIVSAAGRSRGFKLGAVNLASELEGETLGLLNLIGDGIHSITVYATYTMLSNVALKLGSRHLYTSYLLGFQPGADPVGTAARSFGPGTRRVGYGLGLGYRRPLTTAALPRSSRTAKAASRVGTSTRMWPRIEGPPQGRRERPDRHPRERSYVPELFVASSIRRIERLFDCFRLRE